MRGWKLYHQNSIEMISLAVKPAFAFFFAALAACCPLRASDAIHLEFDFAQSDHGFVAGFSDFSTIADPTIYQFSHSWQARPNNLGGAPALFISGINRSDDLFMFWKKRITGLPPNTSVTLTMELELASLYSEGMIGIGGSPALAVAVKAGAVPFEPDTVVDTSQNLVIMNLDKGNQGVGGADMTVIGNVAKPDDGNSNYVLITRHQHGRHMTVSTAADGSLWLIFGTDSGFEGLTALYYTRLTAWINRADKPHLWLEPGTAPGNLRLICNQGTLRSNTTLEPNWSKVPLTTRPVIHNMSADPKRFWVISQP